jgi:hypothetical protein
MKNAKEVLNTIAGNNGHKDWLELTHCEGPITILNCTIEAMELYAELSNSHKPVVSGPASAVCGGGELLAGALAKTVCDGFKECTDVKGIMCKCEGECELKDEPVRKANSR